MAPETNSAGLTGLPEEDCVSALQAILLKGYPIANPETNFPAFAFRLHQFISRGDTVYASIEPKRTAISPYMDKSLCPENETRYCFRWLFAVSAGRNIMSSDEPEIMKAASSIFLPRELNENRISMAVRPVFCI